MDFTNLRLMIENAVGPGNVRPGESQNCLEVTAGSIKCDSSVKIESGRVAVLHALHQQHKHGYLLLDPGLDEDIIGELTESCEPVFDGLLLLPSGHSIESWYAKLGRGNWLLMFSCQPMLRDLQLYDFEPVAENFDRILSSTGAQVIILSWPNNYEWTVAWRLEP